MPDGERVREFTEVLDSDDDDVSDTVTVLVTVGRTEAVSETLCKAVRDDKIVAEKLAEPVLVLEDDVDFVTTDVDERVLVSTAEGVDVLEPCIEDDTNADGDTVLLTLGVNELHGDGVDEREIRLENDSEGEPDGVSVTKGDLDDERVIDGEADGETVFEGSSGEEETVCETERVRDVAAVALSVLEITIDNEMKLLADTDGDSDIDFVDVGEAEADFVPETLCEELEDTVGVLLEDEDEETLPLTENVGLELTETLDVVDTRLEGELSNEVLAVFEIGEADVSAVDDGVFEIDDDALTVAEILEEIERRGELLTLPLADAVLELLEEPVRVLVTSAERVLDALPRSDFVAVDVDVTVCVFKALSVTSCVFETKALVEGVFETDALAVFVGVDVAE